MKAKGLLDSEGSWAKANPYHEEFWRNIGTYIASITGDPKDYIVVHLGDEVLFYKKTQHYKPLVQLPVYGGYVQRELDYEDWQLIQRYPPGYSMFSLFQEFSETRAKEVPETIRFAASFVVPGADSYDKYQAEKF